MIFRAVSMPCSRLIPSAPVIPVMTCSTLVMLIGSTRSRLLNNVGTICLERVERAQIFLAQADDDLARNIGCEDRRDRREKLLLLILRAENEQLFELIEDQVNGRK